MSFLRHGRSIGPMWGKPNRGAGAPLLIVRDESHRLSLGGLLSSRARFRFTGYADHAMKEIRRSSSFQRMASCGLTGCVSPGVRFRIRVINFALSRFVCATTTSSYTPPQYRSLSGNLNLSWDRSPIQAKSLCGLALPADGLDGTVSGSVGDR